MSKVQINNSNVRSFRKTVFNEVDKRLDQAGQILVESAKELVSIEFATSGPSSPGEAPHKRSGDLQAGMEYAVVNGVLEFFNEVEYAYWLETGTAEMAARPFMVVTLMAEAPKIQRIFRR